MFALRKDQLDWEVVGKWNTKDYDFGYDVTLKRTQTFRIVNNIAYECWPKRYKVFHQYVVKGRELLIYSRRLDATDNELDGKNIFSLDELSIRTEQVLWRREQSLWPFERAKIVGEQFFSSKEYRLPAFILLYHTRLFTFESDWKEVLGFSRTLKERIADIARYYA